MPVFNRASSMVLAPKMVTGRIFTEREAHFLIVDLPGDEAFRHRDSYICTANLISERAVPNHPVISYTSGWQFVVRFHETLNAGESIGFICVGN
jgi:hypothetical protein